MYIADSGWKQNEQFLSIWWTIFGQDILLKDAMSPSSRSEIFNI
jgi:hypothetical protein